MPNFIPKGQLSVKHGDSSLLKESAALRALDLVCDGMWLGLGTGSTAARFVEALGVKVAAGLRVLCVPTSEATRAQAEALGIPLTTLDETPHLHLTVDGADEIDDHLRLIKGGGGALLREKIVASATRQMVVVADATKQVQRLGKFPLPVEVIRFAQALVAKRISALGAEVELRTRTDGRPYVSDENNHILDCRFGEIRDPDQLARQLSDMPGVVEHGLFIGMASVVLFARGDQIVELRR